MIPDRYRRHPHYAIGVYMAYAPMGQRTIRIPEAGGESIRSPIVYSGFVTGVDESRTWISVSSDAGLEAVEPGMTVLVRSAAGRWKVRARGADPAGRRLRVAENDGIVWEGATVTVLRHYDLWAVHPRLTEDGGIFMDYDVGYTDQNEREPPKANIGGGPFYPFPLPYPPVQVIPEGQAPTVNLPVSGSRSFAVAPGASIVGYRWRVNGEPASTSNPAILTLNGIGVHWISLEVTDSNGKVGVLHRPFWILRPPAARAMPGRPIPLSALRVRWSPGDGWEAEVEAADIGPELEGGSRVVLWADIVYGDGDPIPTMILDGWVLEGSVEFDAEAERWRIRVISADRLMRNLIGFPTILIAVDSPGRWVEISRPATMARAVYHILKWRSTACEVLPMDPFPPFMGREFPKVEDQSAIAFQAESLGGQIQETVGDRGILALWGCSHDGVLRFWQDPSLVPDAERPAPIPLSPLDIVEDSEVRTMGIEEVGWVRLGGVSPSGPHLAWAPGNVPGQAARVLNMDSLWVTGQQELNNLAGLLYARENVAETIRLEMAGSYLMDPAGPVRLAIPIPIWGSDSGLWQRRWRQIIATLTSYEVTWEREGHLQVRLEARPEAPWVPGEARPIPPPPDWSWEEWPIPPIGEPPPASGNAWWSVYVFKPGGAYALVRCPDIRAFSPRWEILKGPDVGPTGTGWDFCLDPTNPAWGAMLTSNGVWVSRNLRASPPAWERAVSMEEIRAAVGDPRLDFQGGYILPLSQRPGHFAVFLNAYIPEIHKGVPVIVWTENRFMSWSVTARIPVTAMDADRVIAPTERFDQAGFYFLRTRPWYASQNPNYNLYFVPWRGTPQFMLWTGLGWEIAPIGLCSHPMEPGRFAIVHTDNFVHQYANHTDFYLYQGTSRIRSISIRRGDWTRVPGPSADFTYRLFAVDPTRPGIYHFMADVQEGAERRRVGFVVRTEQSTVQLFDPGPAFNYPDIASIQFALWLGGAGEGIVYAVGPGALFAAVVDRETLAVISTYSAPNMPDSAFPIPPVYVVHPDWGVGG